LAIRLGLRKVFHQVSRLAEMFPHTKHLCGARDFTLAYIILFQPNTDEMVVLNGKKKKIGKIHYKKYQSNNGKKKKILKKKQNFSLTQCGGGRCAN